MGVQLWGSDPPTLPEIYKGYSLSHQKCHKLLSHPEIPIKRHQKCPIWPNMNRKRQNSCISGIFTLAQKLSFKVEYCH